MLKSYACPTRSPNQYLRLVRAAGEPVPRRLPVPRPGANSGAGYRGIAVIEGGRYEMILFCSTDHDTPFEVMMLCEADAYEKIRSGFEHIERTFEVKNEPSTQSSLLFLLATSKFPMLRTTL